MSPIRESRPSVVVSAVGAVHVADLRMAWSLVGGKKKGQSGEEESAGSRAQSLHHDPLRPVVRQQAERGVARWRVIAMVGGRKRRCIASTARGAPKLPVQKPLIAIA